MPSGQTQRDLTAEVICGVSLVGWVFGRRLWWPPCIRHIGGWAALAATA